MRSLIRKLLAVLGLIATTASPGGAAVVTFLSQEIPIPTTFAGVSVNLETGAVSNDLAGAPGADANFFLGGTGISNDADQTLGTPTWQPVRTGTGNTDPVDNLSFGTVLATASVTASDFGASGGTTSHFLPFVSGASGYIGFTLELADTTLAYGWMRVTLQDDNTPGTIHEWAYQDDGTSIPVGAIPEPSHALLTVLGLAALALRRRRR